ncbi:MAG: hypothetical protein LC135_05565 [Phycisphaerae bacterium]|jgi:hypothetical protein|nr:hypothetical protein [Phycisphaerae bacterium]MCZ2399323.1 hypothetical protein [Phycisphaerae bacterium]
MASKRQRPKGAGTLYRREPKGPWIARWYDHNRRRRETSTRATDKAAAQREAIRERRPVPPGCRRKRRWWWFQEGLVLTGLRLNELRSLTVGVVKQARRRRCAARVTHC